MSRVQPCVIREDDCEIEGWDDGTRGFVRWRTLISGDRTPSHSLTMGVVELGAGEAPTSRPHQHAQAEAYYFLSGKGVVTIEGTKHFVESGTAVFISGNATHEVVNTGEETLRLLYVFPEDSFDRVHYVFPQD